MQNFLLRIIILGIASFFVYRYRSNLANTMMRQPWIRKLAVRSFMKIPFVRDRMGGQILQFQ
ncbi:MAG TPA: hypothetical protein GXX18_06785 [Bacillales bacterium]|nr:hypothetical protein [Bacillales bacterium]